MHQISYQFHLGKEITSWASATLWEHSYKAGISHCQNLDSAFAFHAEPPISYITYSVLS